MFIYNKTCSKMDKTKILMTNGGSIKVESIAECSLILVFLRVAVLHTFYFTLKSIKLANKFSLTRPNITKNGWKACKMTLV